MNKAGIELLPKINKVLAEVEARLTAEDRSVVERVLPVLQQAKKLSENPFNPLGYHELSAKLKSLAGHLSARIIQQPKIFVGHRFNAEDKIIACKFIRLFELEDLKCYTGEPPKPMEIDEKVQGLITESDAVIIIFTRDRKIENSEFYTTSGWLKSELHFAMGKGKPFLTFYDRYIDPAEKKGIHGEFEYIDFNRDCLDDSLLDAIPYLRQFRLNIIGKTSAGNPQK